MEPDGTITSSSPRSQIHARWLKIVEKTNKELVGIDTWELHKSRKQTSITFNNNSKLIS